MSSNTVRPALARLYTTHEIAMMLQADPSTISKWVDKGLLLAFRTPGGHRRVRGSDLQVFLQQHKMPLPAPLRAGPLKVLSVGGQQEGLQKLARALQASGAGVRLVIAQSPVDALLRLMDDGEEIDGLLLDLDGVELDGPDLVSRVRQRKGLSALRVTLVSSSWSEKLKAAARRAGANELLEAPLRTETVCRAFGALAPEVGR